MKTLLDVLTRTLVAQLITLFHQPEASNVTASLLAVAETQTPGASLQTE